MRLSDLGQWIVYVSQGRNEYIGQKVFDSTFFGVAHKYADRRNELSVAENLPERYSVRFEWFDRK